MPWLAPELLASFAAAGTTAHRLFTSPDAWVERLGTDVLISHKTDPARDAALAGLRDWAMHSDFQPARVFGRFLPRQNAERVAPVLLEGGDLPLTTVVTEAGVRYGIDFAAGYSAGLFIDQRANRAALRRLAPKRLLNTFAYTCSFSVIAALAGGTTVSIDLSKKSLDRGRENFRLNDLPEEGHRFLADDVLDVLPRLERRGERFDAIVLDPPTFSRGNRGRRWQVEQGRISCWPRSTLSPRGRPFCSPPTAPGSTAGPSRASPGSLSRPSGLEAGSIRNRRCPISRATRERRRCG